MTVADRSPVARVREIDRSTAALAVGLAFPSALYLSWLVADVGLRWQGFLVGWLGIAWLLVGATGRRELYITWLRADAIILLVTPVFLNLPLLFNAGRFGIGNVTGFVLTASDLVALIVFALLAAIPAGIAQWLARSA